VREAVVFTSPEPLTYYGNLEDLPEKVRRSHAFTLTINDP
jgi:hypothetical protein